MTTYEYSHTGVVLLVQEIEEYDFFLQLRATIGKARPLYYIVCNIISGKYNNII